jgi:hypothetical protein
MQTAELPFALTLPKGRQQMPTLAHTRASFLRDTAIASLLALTLPATASVAIRALYVANDGDQIEVGPGSQPTA